FHPDVTTHQRYQLMGNRQAETSAPVLACRRAIGLGKSVEDDPLLVGRNTDARITDCTVQGDRWLVGSRPGWLCLLRLIPPDFDDDFALRGELDRITHEIYQDLAPSHDIAYQEIRDIGLDRVDQFETLLMCTWGQGFHGHTEVFTERKEARLE